MISSVSETPTSRAIDVGVALILAVVAAWGNVLWIQHNRFGLALTIDEAGYISQAIAYANALKYGGLSAWLTALAYPTKFAPLSPIVTSVLMMGLGVRDNVAFYTHILFYAGIVLVTYWWVRARSSRLVAISAALLVATLPDIVLYTRTYQYGLPTAFFFLLANFAYFKSERFASLLWSVAAGAALGLMLLSRTMSIAFLPAFGLVWLLDCRKVLPRRGGHLAASVGVFLLVAVPWYAMNIKEIFGYLFSFGYGASANEYGAGATSVLSIGYLISRIQGFMDSLYLFHFLLVFVLFWVCVLRQAGNYFRTRKMSDPDLVVPACIVVLCVVILFSSKNRGSGFEVPLFAVMVFCGMSTVNDAIKGTALRAGTFAVVAMFSLTMGYLQSTTVACDSAPNLITRPLFSITPIKVCDGYVEQYIRATDGLAQVIQSSWKSISYPDQKAWRRVSAELADRLHDIDKKKRSVVYVSRNRLVNVNTVMLDFVEKFKFILPAEQIEPAMLHSEVDYNMWFGKVTEGKACAVIMMSNTDGDFFPRPRLDVLKKIVIERGFALAARIPTPAAGTYAEIWASKAECGDE